MFAIAALRQRVAMASGTIAPGGAAAGRWRSGGAQTLRVVVAADEPDLVVATRTILAAEHVVVAGASLGLGDVGALARRLVPNVIVLTARSCDPAVVAAVRAIRDVSPAPAVVLVAGRVDESYVHTMLEAGVRGYLSPDDPDLGRAVRAVASGGAYFSPDAARVVRRGYLRRGGVSIRALFDRLTEAERAVLHGLVHGETTGELGARLHLSRHALDGCRRRIVQALD